MRFEGLPFFIAHRRVSPDYRFQVPTTFQEAFSSHQASFSNSFRNVRVFARQDYYPETMKAR
jgi:hypothetical protein